MIRILEFGLGVLIFFILFPSSVLAASLTISSNQIDVTETSEVEVNVNLAISTDDGTHYYLRGAFFKPGSNNSCGYTQNGDQWYNGPYTANDGWKNLPIATIQNHIWTGTIKVKIDDQDSHCQDSGIYSFKVIRYTDGGSSTDSDNALSFNVILPTPTPTPSSTPKPTPTDKPTPTPTPTRTPTSSRVPTSTKVSVTPDSDIFHTASDDADILGTSSASFDDSPFPTERQPTISPEVMGVSQNTSPFVFLILGGVSLTAVGGILGYREWKSRNMI